MSNWDTYPSDYRSHEVLYILSAVQAGECVSLMGLSGSGKSNLLGFLAHRVQADLLLTLVDCNRLPEASTPAFFRLTRSSLGDKSADVDETTALEALIARRLEESPALCLLFDRFDALNEKGAPALFSNLRALRDAHKYALTYVTASRRLLNAHTEFAELFYAHTLWLGPLSTSDAHWNIIRYAQRKRLDWDEDAMRKIIELSWSYLSLLRAVCEAFALGACLDAQSLAAHPAVSQRVEEFWADNPDENALRNSLLWGHPLLFAGRTIMDTTQLTAKEHLLWEYLQAHPEQVCDKDNLIHAVWPEDKIYERGIRDDSLAQLMRRLREKVEPDPSNPKHILTVAGRGYRYFPH